MGRYLTPARIGLLALLVVYSESVVPAEATIPVLSFLASQVIPQSGEVRNEEPGTRSIRAAGTIEAIEEVTKQYASGIPGRTIWDLLLNKIWRIDSLDALHVFFEDLTLLLQGHEKLDHGNGARQDARGKIQLSSGSPMGLFVRRAHLEFTRLQFSDTVILWQSLMDYRSPTFRQWRKRNSSVKGPYAGDEASSLRVTDELVSGLEISPTKIYHKGQDTAVSVDDVERLLEFQVHQIQRMGTRLPKTAMATLRSMLERGTSVPHLVFYVQFLEAWKTRDYLVSFDRLHQYFDYTMHNKDRTFYQYALLNLAALHADFGAFEEAMSAIHETISTAREHNDMCCLNYSLSWLYHFGKAFPTKISNFQSSGMMGTDKEALNFLKAKSKEAGMWSIFSSSLLAEARLSLSNGEAPSQTFETLLKASLVNMTKNLTATNGTHAALLSTTYGRLGVSCQSMLSEEVFIHCYGPQSPAEDRLQGASLLANMLEQQGRFSDAWQHLMDIEPDIFRTLKYQKSWAANMGLLRLKRLLHCNRLDDAVLVLDELKSLRDSSSDVFHAMTFLEIELLIRQQEYPEALSVLEMTVKNLDQGPFDVCLNIKSMILKAQIYDKAGAPQKGLSVVLRAATTAYAAKVLPMLWEAIATLCAILNSLEEFEASILLLESVMPRLLEYEDCYLIACSFAVLADSHVGQAGKVRRHSLQLKERLHKASENIDRAFDYFSRCQNVQGQCEMLAKKATIMQINGDSVLANDCAAKYLSIQKAVLDDNAKASLQ